MRPAALLLFVVAAGPCNKSDAPQEDTQPTDLPPLEPVAPPRPVAPPQTAPSRTLPSAAAPGDAGSAHDSGGEAATGHDFPLQAWMKANCAPPVLTGDLDALAAAFDQIAAFAPTPAAGFDNWVSIAKDGADAARAASMVGVKGACRGCHQQYKDRYRGALRSRPLP